MEQSEEYSKEDEGRDVQIMHRKMADLKGGKSLLVGERERGRKPVGS
jgi:hypothetical protein